MKKKKEKRKINPVTHDKAITSNVGFQAEGVSEDHDKQNVHVF